MRAFALLFACCLALLGCKGPCRQLSEKLCECAINSVEKDNCLNRAQSQANSTTVSAEDEAVCTSLLEGCDCKKIDTPDGKVACGLANAPPQ